jgi:hypothetical protein
MAVVGGGPVHFGALAIGALLLSVGGCAGVIAHHDGVLDPVTLSTLPPDGSSVPVELRLQVISDPEEPGALLAALNERVSVLPRALDAAMRGQQVVLVAVDGAHQDPGVPVVAKFPGNELPPRGLIVVAAGTMGVHYAMVETSSGQPAPMPVLMFHISSWHRPIVF